MTTLAEQVLSACRSRGLTVCTAESCTGGLIAAALTDIAGSSDVFDRGYVTYSNAAKIDMLAVDASLLDRVGAVSRDVALAMASGALAASGTDVAVAVTGVAGPGGGTPLKPVGLVFIAVVTRSSELVEEFDFSKSSDPATRATIRSATRDQALGMILRSVA